MKSLLHIKIIALFLLLIFSASIFAVCTCKHENSAAVIKHQCCCKKMAVAAAENNKEHQCPCEKKIIKFNKAEKQLAQVTIFKPNVIANAILLQPLLQDVPRNFTSSKLYVKEKIFQLHQPPEYYIMYQALRI